MTTTTTATTTMMATIDITCSDGEVAAAAASEEDVGMATTQALTGSSFALGDRQDRVLTIGVGSVKITSTSVLEKHVTLTTKRWARFMSIRKKVDIEAREVNHQDTSGGLSCTHWRTILRVSDLQVWMC